MLSLDAVSYTYAADTRFAQTALSGVSANVSPGEMVLVAGATGSGKSTLLRVAAGLVEPESGSVAIDGAPLTRASARGAVGLIFQDAEAQLFADTLLEDVAFGPKNMGAAPAEVDSIARDALAAVGLDPDKYGQRSPFTLSGGEARRAAVAGVLALRPSYVLADEPTAGLDSRGRAALFTVLAEVRKTTGIVVVSHALEEFLGEADRVLLLERGRTAWYGAAHDLIGDPQPLIEAGLVPPDVLEVQRLLAKAGRDVGRPFTLDPVAAAASIAAAPAGQSGGGR